MGPTIWNRINWIHATTTFAFLGHIITSRIIRGRPLRIFKICHYRHMCKTRIFVHIKMSYLKYPQNCNGLSPIMREIKIIVACIQLALWSTTGILTKVLLLLPASSLFDSSQLTAHFFSTTLKILILYMFVISFWRKLGKWSRFVNCLAKRLLLYILVWKVKFFYMLCGLFAIIEWMLNICFVDIENNKYYYILTNKIFFPFLYFFSFLFPLPYPFLLPVVILSTPYIS